MYTNHRRPATRISRPVAFWLLAVTLLAFFAAASAFSPLLVVYQHRWGFSPTMLTTIFAVYALGLLVALLTVGGLSDYIGRRPVLAAALIVEAASMAVFLTAGAAVRRRAVRPSVAVASSEALAAAGPSRPGAAKAARGQ